MNRTLAPAALLGGILVEEAPPLLERGTWYRALEPGDGLEYRLEPQSLADARYLTADLLLDGSQLVVFQLSLQEGDSGPVFQLNFGLLNQCSARMRLPLDAVNQNRWMYEREGAWLKPLVGGARVDLARVDRVRLTVMRKGDEPARWMMTALQVATTEPAKLTELTLPRGPLLDEFGQSAIHEWPEKTRSRDELTQRLHQQLSDAPQQQWPEEFSRWGGWKGRQEEATGYFRAYHDGRRWWLVDPAGHPFWSAGVDCVQPGIDTAYGGLESALSWLPEAEGEFAALGRSAGPRQTSFNFLGANFIRAFGADWHESWKTIAVAELRRAGFNTVANWSEWRAASEAKFPYTRPLDLRQGHTPRVYRDFPDVFHPAWPAEASDFAQQLVVTRDDPALIGYFLMNEPTWGFASETPAEGMLFNTQVGPCREALSAFLQERHGTDAGLAAVWGSGVTFAAVSSGEWTFPITDAARRDLEAFSGVMVERLYGELSRACRAVDPHHLNLGARYYTIPPAWAAEGMRHFDVFSFNCYADRVSPDAISRIAGLLRLPVMVGEWHFGALDVGLPASGIGRVKNQEERGRAFRVYTETAAALPDCIGTHYFTLYDQSALGRFDGENYNIGFMDTCHRPYEPLARAARTSHERLYAVAAGLEQPFNDAPEYLPKLFI